MKPVTDPALISQLESGSSGMKPVNDPALISQLEGTASNNMNPLMRIASDIDIGGANFGRNLLNAPHNIANYISPALGSMVPTVPAAINATDYNQVYGVNNPGFVDKLIQGAAQYAPYGSVGGVTAGVQLPAQVGIGALYGATQSANPLKGALLGAGSNAAGAAAGDLLNVSGKALKNYLSQFASSGLTKSINNSLEGAKTSSDLQAFNLAKNNLINNWIPKEQAAWKNASQVATQLDAKGVPFNDANYNQILQSQLENLQGQSSRQSGLARANKDSEGLLSNYLNDQHSTFTDAVEHNKALNQDFQNEIAPGQPLPFKTVNFAKSNLEKAIEQNIKNNNLQDTFGSAWNNANAITQQKNQLFNTIVGNSGKDNISSFANFINGKNPVGDPTTFIKDYLPTSRGDGIQKMQQFSQMVGDPIAAKNALKQNYFENSFTSLGVDSKKFLSKYNNLSDEQQGFLFSPQENQVIQSLNKINDMHPSALSKTNTNDLVHHSISASLGGLLGLGLGHGMEGFGAGAALGALGGIVGKAALSKLFENPGISNYFINSLNPTSTATLLPSASSIAARFASPLITPALIRNFGGQ